MNLFHIIDEGVAILRLRGRRYRQTKIYSRGEDVFAAVGADFIRLTRGGQTTDPNISCVGVQGPGVAIRGGVPVFTPSPNDQAA